MEKTSDQFLVLAGRREVQAARDDRKLEKSILGPVRYTPVSSEFRCATRVGNVVEAVLFGWVPPTGLRRNSGVHAHHGARENEELAPRWREVLVKAGWWVSPAAKPCASGLCIAGVSR